MATCVVEPGFVTELEGGANFIRKTRQTIVEEMRVPLERGRQREEDGAELVAEPPGDVPEKIHDLRAVAQLRDVRDLPRCFQAEAKIRGRAMRPICDRFSLEIRRNESLLSVVGKCPA